MNSTAGEPQRDARASRNLLRYMYPQLGLRFEVDDQAPETPEGRRWSLRGEPRTRATFGAPHPADFPGGLPIPDEYPR